MTEYTVTLAFVGSSVHVGLECADCGVTIALSNGDKVTRNTLPLHHCKAPLPMADPAGMPVFDETGKRTVVCECGQRNVEDAPTCEACGSVMPFDPSQIPALVVREHDLHGPWPSVHHMLTVLKRRTSVRQADIWLRDATRKGAIERFMDNNGTDRCYVATALGAGPRPAGR